MAGAVAALDAAPLAAVLAVPGNEEVLRIAFNARFEGKQCIPLICEAPALDFLRISRGNYGHGGGQNNQDAKGCICIHEHEGTGASKNSLCLLLSQFLSNHTAILREKYKHGPVVANKSNKYTPLMRVTRCVAN
ncbi:hypothetical protein HU200_036456 [Digitaria exilis]|uniref:Uncharacterized protein n=1 Tax=Digitaria exilis TaxID=1010633 RepID=A0A835BLP4_9POAL|nr:hypothetical protein HU200_036456 [Digitaria exilis]